MSGDLLTQKYQKIFDNFDVDKDGIIEQTDIDALIQTWCRQFGVEPRSADWQRMTTLANQMWQDVAGVAGQTDAQGKGIVAKEGWVGVVQRPEFIDNVAVPFALVAFDLADRDKDEKLTVDEVSKAMGAGGMSEEESQHAFSLLDTDKDGFITKEEFRQAVVDFYKSTDPGSPGNALAGLLG